MADLLVQRRDVLTGGAQLAVCRAVFIGRRLSADVVADPTKGSHEARSLALVAGLFADTELKEDSEHVFAVVVVEVAPGGEEEVNTGGRHERHATTVLAGNRPRPAQPLATAGYRRR